LNNGIAAFAAMTGEVGIIHKYFSTGANKHSQFLFSGIMMFSFC
jgi:hypothetical protein